MMIKVTIRRSKWSGNFTGITHRNNIFRDVLGDNAASSNNGVITDGYSGENDGVCANPNIVAYFYREIVLSLFQSELW